LFAQQKRLETAIAKAATPSPNWPNNSPPNLEKTHANSTAIPTIGNLIAGRLFKIPEYQRAYSWQTKQRKTCSKT